MYKFHNKKKLSKPTSTSKLTQNLFGRPFRLRRSPIKKKLKQNSKNVASPTKYSFKPEFNKTYQNKH